MTSCSICSAAISPRTKSGLCAKHARGRGHGAHPRVKSCSACGIGITAFSKTGMCKACANRARNSTDEHRRKVSEGQKRRLLDPAFRAKKARIATRNAQKSYLDPDRRQRAREIALAHLALAFTPEAIELRKRRILEARGRQADRRLAWCPLEYRALHHRNVNSKRMKASDSRAMIEGMIADRDAIRSGKLDEALFWLTTRAPITKTEDGRYRFGTAILTPGEVVRRAELWGWKPMERAA